MSTESQTPDTTGHANMVKEQSGYSKRDTQLTMIGVLLILLLAALDQTVVSTAMPRILGEFNGLDRYTWVTTAYLLTSTVMIPMYGKLSDIFGRKIIFLIGVVLFLIGSAACGVAQTVERRFGRDLPTLWPLCLMSLIQPANEQNIFPSFVYAECVRLRIAVANPPATNEWVCVWATR
jgi:MFS family permease